MKLVDLATRLGLELGGAPAAAGAELSGLAPVERAGPRDLTYVAERRHEAALAGSRAGAVVCSAELARSAPVPCLVSPEPAADFARATRLLFARTRPAPGVHPTASVAETARIGAGASVGPYAVVGAGAEVGARAEIHAHVVLYPDVHVGEETVVYAGAVLREGTRVGARCVLQPNVVLGGDGFGFARARSGAYEKIEQMGVVTVGDDVEIGAATTVDRATFDATTVGRGTKIDNLVQIGHNSSVGEETVLCAQVGLAGSTRVGRGVTLAGQVGVAGHLEVGDDAVATAQTGIPSSVAPGAVVSGYPAIDNRAWLKSSAAFVRLPDLARTVRRLEARLAALEARLSEQEAADDAEKRG